jgi:hypothetical protein
VARRQPHPLPRRQHPAARARDLPRIPARTWGQGPHACPCRLAWASLCGHPGRHQRPCQVEGASATGAPQHAPPFPTPRGASPSCFLVDAQGSLGRWMPANMPGRVGPSCCQQAESLSGGSRRSVRARLALRLCAARDGGEPGPGPTGWPQAPGANALRSAGAPRSSSAAMTNVCPAAHAHVVRAASTLIHAPLHVAYPSSARWVTPGPWLGMIVRHGACAMLLHSTALQIAILCRGDGHCVPSQGRRPETPGARTAARPRPEAPSASGAAARQRPWTSSPRRRQS